MLEIKTVDVSIESRIVSNLIMSTQLLSRVRPYADPKLLESNLSRIVCGWVFEYYDMCNKAPGPTIKDIFIVKRDTLGKDDADMIAEYLSNCSDEWKPTNDKYIEDLCLKHWQERYAITYSDAVKQASEAGDYARIERLNAEYKKPEAIVDDGVDLFSEEAADDIQDAYNDEEDIVMEFPGAYGKVCGPLTTDDFVCFLAPPKRGKTWFLMDLAFRSAIQGNNTVYFSLEMSKKQTIRRMWQMVSGKGRKASTENISYFVDGECGAEIVTEPYQVNELDLTAEGIKAMQKRYRDAINGGSLRIFNYKTKSFSVQMLREKILSLFKRFNFVPKTIVIDYPDIMKLPNSKEKRIQLDDLYAELRGLGQEFNALLAGASQSNRETVTGKRDADEGNIAEASAKLGHITKLIVLNQNEEDGKHGIMRIKVTTTRETKRQYDQAVVTQCLEIGRPYMDSRLMSELAVQDENYERM